MNVKAEDFLNGGIRKRDDMQGRSDLAKQTGDNADQGAKSLKRSNGANKTKENSNDNDS